MNLQSLAAKYGTDKLEHGYIPFYEQNLPKSPKRILEIGVKEGRSLAMWAEYFPDAEIHGLDLFEEYEMKNVQSNILNNTGYNDSDDHVFLHKGNQCDWRLLEELRKYDFDVIVDDGSHNSRDQLMTFFGLFNGKHYFIEDLHCNYEEFYSQGLPMGQTARTIFNDLKLIYDGYTDGTVIKFNKENKIVCINATEPD
jgi:hypothetical protein